MPGIGENITMGPKRLYVCNAMQRTFEHINNIFKELSIDEDVIMDDVHDVSSHTDRTISCRFYNIIFNNDASAFNGGNTYNQIAENASFRLPFEEDIIAGIVEPAAVLTNA